MGHLLLRLVVFGHQLPRGVLGVSPLLDERLVLGCHSDGLDVGDTVGDDGAGAE